MELPGGVRLLHVFHPKEDSDSLVHRRKKHYNWRASPSSQSNTTDQFESLSTSPNSLLKAKSSSTISVTSAASPSLVCEPDVFLDTVQESDSLFNVENTSSKNDSNLVVSAVRSAKSVSAPQALSKPQCKPTTNADSQTNTVLLFKRSSNESKIVNELSNDTPELKILSGNNSEVIPCSEQDRDFDSVLNLDTSLEHEEENHSEDKSNQENTNSPQTQATLGKLKSELNNHLSTEQVVSNLNSQFNEETENATLSNNSRTLNSGLLMNNEQVDRNQYSDSLNDSNSVKGKPMLETAISEEITHQSGDSAIQSTSQCSSKNDKSQESSKPNVDDNAIKTQDIQSKTPSSNPSHSVDIKEVNNQRTSDHQGNPEIEFHSESQIESANLQSLSYSSEHSSSQSENPMLRHDNQERLTLEFVDSENSEGIEYHSTGEKQSIKSNQFSSAGSDFEEVKTGNPSNEKHSINSETWNADIQGLDELILYVQGHSDTLMVLLLEHTTNCNKTYINSLVNFACSCSTLTPVLSQKNYNNL